jgi:hypothetical protein
MEENKMTPMQLPEDIKKRAETIAKKKGYIVQDPGYVWVGEDRRKWVFVVDKATDMPIWMLLE